MADEYDPMDPPTFNAEDDDDDDDDNETYDPERYDNHDQVDVVDTGGDEDDDYDPSGFEYSNGVAQVQQKETIEPPQHTVAENSVQGEPAPKQQKVAGFIVEDSDDEQEDNSPLPSLQNGSNGTQSDRGAVAVSEAQDVSLSSAPQDTAASSTSLNGSTTLPVPAFTSSSVPAPSLQPSTSEQGKTVTPPASTTASVVPTPLPETNSIAPAPSQTAAYANGSMDTLPARLPHDKVGQLEDRIKDDPKGDTEAWMALIDHYYGKGQYDYTREVYRRFLKCFPTAVSMWIKYIQMENELDERDNVVRILNEVLMQVPNVELWKLYLDHVRRALPLINDTDNQNRTQINGAFEATLEQVGIDPDSGILWREYVDFIKDYPGTVGGSSWQDLQKADLLRKAYQRAIKLPHSDTIKLWKEYGAFEMGLHKATGMKHIQEQSPHYVEARKAKTQLDQVLVGLERSSLPRLPPIYGYEGEDEFGTQVEKWRGWIAWERDEDPLVYKVVEDDAYRKRVIYAYRQATMSLCFYPQIWFDAASWCFAQNVPNMTEEGEKLLDKGIAANPESVLLAMMKADRVESSLESGNTDEVLIRNGEKLDVPYEEVHTALYQLRSKTQEKDKRAVQRIQQEYASLPPEEPLPNYDDDDLGDDTRPGKPKTREEQMKAEIDAAKAASAVQLDLLKRTISYIWVAKMRAFRRIQGQGKPPKKGDAATKTVKGFRGIFADARPRGPLSGDVYVASALMEWHCYKDPAATRIFDRGLKLFPTDENFILENVKHLIMIGDVTNARVVFESTIPKIMNAADLTTQQKQHKCRALITYMHDFESKYGDLAQINKLEKRMAELYPDEPEISRFSLRFSLPTFDAMDIQLLLSPTQARPRAEVPQIAVSQQPLTSIEQPQSPRGPEILLGPNGPYVASPKRPLDDSDADVPQRKFMRAESPLKGAAGARVQGHKASQSIGSGGGGFSTKTFVPANISAPTGPFPLPPQITAILSMLPNAASYTGTRFDPARLISFLPSVNVEHARARFHAGQLHRP